MTMWWLKRALLGVVTAAALAGCSQITTFDEFHARDAGTDASAPTDGAADAPAPDAGTATDAASSRDD